MLDDYVYQGIADESLKRQDLADLRAALAELETRYQLWRQGDYPAGRAAPVVAQAVDDPERAATALARAALLMQVGGRVDVRGMFDAVSARLLYLIEKDADA